MPFFVCGKYLLGKVELTSSGRYIATTFFHVFLVPLFPLESLIVTKRSLFDWKGIEIGLYKKSVIAGYIRGTAIIGSFFIIVSGGYIYDHIFSGAQGRHEDFLIALSLMSLGVLSLIAMLYSYISQRFSIANEDTEGWMERILENPDSLIELPHPDRN